MFLERRITRRIKFKNIENISILYCNRINVTIRRTLGEDIDASCGQLRKKFIETSKTL